MSNEDLESYESGAQLALYEEYKNVAELFTYIVETERRFYLANQVKITPRATDGAVFFEVEMQDVWVWDVFRSSRFVKNVKVYSVRDVNVEERAATEDFVVPTVTGFDPSAS
ncbi:MULTISPECIES: DUF2469 family protein [Rothia]|uniref:Histidine kinase n=1 Tax=Rothia nasimurium TaxID=85336 RepID=A0A1Y1RS11_9MICC|nr:MULTISPECIES: DUF2469 family protein [Rothia]ORC22171.1 histidine kinase [Rothia nasimurium]